jgi:hypothetical protein
VSNSHTLLAALAARHSDAVFVEECKLGAQGSRRLDAWVLLKTWSPPTTIGYELKVSRSDFLNDGKWPAYLPVCHEFYFVCPAKLISVDELPQDVGLLWQAGTGGRLVTKRKAVRRQPDPAALLGLMTYVLMSRSRTVANMWAANEPDRTRFWSDWLMERRGDQHVGHLISSRLRKQLEDARAAQRRAEYERDRLEGVKRKLAELGLNEGAGAYEIEDRLNGGELRRVLGQVHQLSRRLTELTETLPA